MIDKGCFLINYKKYNQFRNEPFTVSMHISNFVHKDNFEWDPNFFKFVIDKIRGGNYMYYKNYDVNSNEFTIQAYCEDLSALIC